jgi:hypothetical protein
MPKKKNKKTRDKQVEAFILQLLRRTVARRNSYMDWLEKHPDAPIDQDLLSGSEPLPWEN